MNKVRALLTLIFAFTLFVQCQSTSNQKSIINLNHLNYLYTWLKVDGQPWAGIAIYAEYPDYHYLEAPGEGLICVDDIARATIVYLRHAQYYKSTDSAVRARQLIRTLLKMQASNGCFYNFIDSQGQIQKQLKNSKPLPDWWTWRATWALAEFLKNDPSATPSLKDSAEQAVQKVLPHVEMLNQNLNQWQEVAGFKLPVWLPQRHAADQAGLLIKALCALHAATGQPKLLPLIKAQARGLMSMQIKYSTSEFYGAFLSWQNIWHAYGNIQADALLDAFEVTGDSAFFYSALLEIDHFYPELMKTGLLHQAKLKNENGKIIVTEKRQFEQIAYDLRPMIWAALHAFKLTKQAKYGKLTLRLASWFSGNNAAQKAMYDAQSGRCFDGLITPEQVNLNAGAESTIEALLALMEVERVPELRKELLEQFFE